MDGFEGQQERNRPQLCPPSLEHRRTDAGFPGVMIVGASASGTQIAWELRRAGRKVLMAVGEHVRAPRTYRGRDLQWWMDRAGVMDERYDMVEDLVRARTHPSLQLTGSDERMTLDLNALGDIGVRFVGRLAGIVGTDSPVLGLAAKHVRAVGSEDEPVSEPNRRMGGKRRIG